MLSHENPFAPKDDAEHALWDGVDCQWRKHALLAAKRNNDAIRALGMTPPHSDEDLAEHLYRANPAPKPKRSKKK